MLVDPRLLVCRGIFRSADGKGPFAADGDRLLWLVADQPGIGTRPLVARAQSLAADADNPSDAILGYAWSKDVAPDGATPLVVSDLTNPQGEAGPGMAIAVPQSTVKSVTVQGASTHVLQFLTGAGGMLSSWTIDGTQILNTSTTWRRGMQWGMEWTDQAIGEFVRHNPVQGGDIHGSSGRFRGGILRSFDAGPAAEGGTKISLRFTPIEADPGGALAIPLVRSWHGGGSLKPVFWTGLTVDVVWWINWRGYEGVHQVAIDVTGAAVQSGFFDASIYLAAFLDASLFTKLRVYDALTAAETTLTAGVAGVPGYQVNWRRYVANLANYRGDDEAAAAAMPLTSRFAGVAATGAADSDLAVMWANRFDAESVAGADRTLGDDVAGNGWCWLQNRGGTGGPAGTNALMVAPGSFLTNRLNPQSQVRRLSKVTSQRYFLITGTWAQCKARVGSIQR